MPVIRGQQGIFLENSVSNPAIRRKRPEHLSRFGCTGQDNAFEISEDRIDNPRDFDRYLVVRLLWIEVPGRRRTGNPATGI